MQNFYLKNLDSINDMIKRNEMRIKSSNKRRLLSESELDDEADSNSNPSQNPSKNVTKIITLNSGFHFTKRLQNIKNDRMNTKNMSPHPSDSSSATEAIHLLP